MKRHNGRGRFARLPALAVVVLIAGCDHPAPDAGRDDRSVFVLCTRDGRTCRTYRGCTDRVTPLAVETTGAAGPQLHPSLLRESCTFAVPADWNMNSHDNRPQPGFRR